MTIHTKHIGILGEKIAASYLTNNNYSIIERNVNAKYGEIDIIAKKDNIICFFEVKTRIGIDKGYPHEAVDKRKINHLKTAIQYYVLKNNLKRSKLSLSIVSVLLNIDLSLHTIKVYDYY